MDSKLPPDTLINFGDEAEITAPLPELPRERYLKLLLVIVREAPEDTDIRGLLIVIDASGVNVIPLSVSEPETANRDWIRVTLVESLKVICENETDAAIE